MPIGALVYTKNNGVCMYVMYVCPAMRFVVLRHMELKLGMRVGAWAPKA